MACTLPGKDRQPLHQPAAARQIQDSSRHITSRAIRAGRESLPRAGCTPCPHDRAAVLRRRSVRIPAAERPEAGETIHRKAVSDHSHKELHPDEIFNLFKSTFENVGEPYSINEVHFQQKDGGITTQVTSTFNGKTIITEATGNGRLDAVSNALKKAYEMKFTLVTYQEHALEKSSSSKAIAYVGIQKPDGTLSWGAGVDPDIIRASIDALVTAINNR